MLGVLRGEAEDFEGLLLGEQVGRGGGERGHFLKVAVEEGEWQGEGDVAIKRIQVQLKEGWLDEAGLAVVEGEGLGGGLNEQRVHQRWKEEKDHL